MTESSNISHAPENMLHVLPAPTNWITRVGMPTQASRRIILALAAIRVPEQVPILINSKKDVARPVNVPEILPTIPYAVPGVGMPVEAP